MLLVIYMLQNDYSARATGRSSNAKDVDCLTWQRLMLAVHNNSPGVRSSIYPLECADRNTSRMNSQSNESVRKETDEPE
jgi:hypothetical protein